MFLAVAVRCKSSVNITYYSLKISKLFSVFFYKFVCSFFCYMIHNICVLCSSKLQVIETNEVCKKALVITFVKHLATWHAWGKERGEILQLSWPEGSLGGRGCWGVTFVWRGLEVEPAVVRVQPSAWLVKIHEHGSRITIGSEPTMILEARSTLGCSWSENCARNLLL